MEKAILERSPQSTNAPKRVAVYCRVAANGTDPVNSLESQRAYYVQKISDNPDWKLAGVYADEGLGTTAMKKRKDFSRMLTACKQDHVDIILTKSVSRFSRNMAECLEAVKLLQALGVTVIFEIENIDISAENGDPMMTLMHQFTLMESEHITRNLIFPIQKRLL